MPVPDGAGFSGSTSVSAASSARSVSPSVVESPAGSSPASSAGSSAGVGAGRRARRARRCRTASRCRDRGGRGRCRSPDGVGLLGLDVGVGGVLGAVGVAVGGGVAGRVLAGFSAGSSAGVSAGSRARRARRCRTASAVGIEVAGVGAVPDGAGFSGSTSVSAASWARSVSPSVVESPAGSSPASVGGLLGEGLGLVLLDVEERATGGLRLRRGLVGLRLRLGRLRRRRVRLLVTQVEQRPGRSRGGRLLPGLSWPSPPAPARCRRHPASNNEPPPDPRRRGTDVLGLRDRVLGLGGVARLRLGLGLLGRRRGLRRTQPRQHPPWTSPAPADSPFTDASSICATSRTSTSSRASPLLCSG